MKPWRRAVLVSLLLVSSACQYGEGPSERRAQPSAPTRLPPLPSGSEATHRQPWINYNRPARGADAAGVWTPERVVESGLPLFAVDGAIGTRRRAPKAQGEIAFVKKVKALAPRHPVWNRFRMEVYAPSKRSGTVQGFELDWLATLPIEEWEEDFAPWREQGYELVSHPDTGGFWKKAVAHWRRRGRYPVPYLMRRSDSKTLEIARLVVNISHPDFLDWLVANARLTLELGHGDYLMVGSKTDLWVWPQKQRATPDNTSAGAMTRSPFRDWRAEWTLMIARLHAEGFRLYAHDQQKKWEDRGNWWSEYGVWQYITGMTGRQFADYGRYQKWRAAGSPRSTLPKVPDRP